MFFGSLVLFDEVIDGDDEAFEIVLPFGVDKLFISE